MDKLSRIAKKNIDKIKNNTGNSPDIIIKNINVLNNSIYVIFNETLSDKNIIDQFILKYLTTTEMDKDKKDDMDIFNFLKENIPTHKTISIDNYSDLFYNILSGFSIIMVDGYNEVLSLETKVQLDSGILESKNEMVIKGPKDSFTENYQTNIGLIRRRIKTEELWLEELIVGSKSKTKVGIMYVNNIAKKDLVTKIIDKLKNIEIDGIFDSNYVVEMISENKNNVFANYISTERPDQVSMHLLDGRIAIIVENTQYVIVIPALFIDFFQTTEDFYQKVLNVNLTRFVRLIGFLVALVGPAIYIAITTFNIEAIPENLVMSLTAQRNGVPFPTVVETLMMIITFEVLRETDSRLPSAIGSSLSIVGAIVLGQAAVAAGIVSPITIIVVSITAISGMISYNMDMVGGVRWWRIIFLILASLFGLFGVLIAGLLFIINTTSIKSFGDPYMTPFAPFYRNQQGNAIFLSNKRKFEKRNPLTTKNNVSKQEENK